MRHAQPAFQAIFSEVRKAAAFAALFTFGAGVLALALPFAVMHAIEAAERRVSLEALALVAVVTVLAAVLRTALLSSRDRILLQAALWFDHTAGSAVLADRLGRGVMPETLEADRAALDRCKSAIAGPATAALLDGVAAIAPLAVLFLIHPALGAVSLLIVAGVISAALARSRVAASAAHKAAEAHAAADRSWRMASTNGPMIAMRNMADGIVADWETLSRASVVSSYALAKPARRSTAVLRAVDVMSCVLVATVGVWLVLGDSITLAGLAAAGVLHVMLVRAILAAHDHVSDLACLEAALQHLSAEPVAMANRPVPIETAPTQTLPVSPPARPRFDVPQPLPQARPPAAYGAMHSRGGF